MYILSLYWHMMVLLMLVASDIIVNTCYNYVTILCVECSSSCSTFSLDVFGIFIGILLCLMCLSCLALAEFFSLFCRGVLLCTYYL
jgi:hypothetical protein